MYFKIENNGYIQSVGMCEYWCGTEITESEYNQILELIQNRPTETETIGYRLKTDLTWEAYEKEPVPEPEPTADEVLAILTGESE